MIGRLLLSTLVGLAAPLLMAFYAGRTLQDIFDAPCRRSERTVALVLAVLGVPWLLAWLALVPLQWFAFFWGKRPFEVLLPLGLNAFCLALELPLLPRALRLRQVVARFDELTADSGLDRRYRYPARVQRWAQGERSGYPVIAIPVDPEQSITSWFARRFAAQGDLLDFEFAREPGLVVMARTRRDLPASLELFAAAGLLGINRTRVVSRPLPTSSRKLATGDPAFDQVVHVHAADADVPTVERLIAPSEILARIAVVFARHPLLYARRALGSGTASLLGGRALDPPFDRAGFFVVEWIPTPRHVDQLIEALDVVAGVACCLDALPGRVAAPPNSIQLCQRTRSDRRFRRQR